MHALNIKLLTVDTFWAQRLYVVFKKQLGHAGSRTYFGSSSVVKSFQLLLGECATLEINSTNSVRTGDGTDL